MTYFFTHLLGNFEIIIVSEFRAAFDAFDEDGSNAICKDELGTVMKRLGLNPTDKELAKIMKEHDQDSKISWLLED